MPATIRINEIVLVTPENRISYSFASGINAIFGEVGSGKSSMLELIKFGLGGNGVVTPAVLRGVRTVVVSATVGGERLTFERGINERTVTALEPDGTLREVLSVGTTKAHRRASTFLLEALDLPELRVTNARPTKKSQPLTFFDIYAYCYVPQAEIDRSIVNHLDPLTRAKRIGAFEVLLGLTDDSISAARVRLGQLQDELVEARQPLGVIDRFLEAAGTPTEEALTLRRGAAQEALVSAERTLAELRTQSLTATHQTAAMRDRLSQTARDASSVASRIQELEAGLATRRQLATELRSDLARVDRAQAAGGILGNIAFMQCPRCFQGLDPARADEGQCYVCGQDDVVTDLPSDDTSQAERSRIRSLQAELQELDLTDSQELQQLTDQQRGIGLALSEIEAEIDRQTQEFVSPHYEALEAASADAASARVEAADVERLLAFWAERDTYARHVRDLEAAVGDAQIEISQGVERLSSRRERIGELSDIFDEIIQRLEMPWYNTGAYIDGKTYLPIVNGVSIEKLGSGGMKMMTNVAYHLALLTYGLSEGLTSIPDLLIIDSPRKNLGQTTEDQAHASAFYSWIAALTRAYEGRFQILVADNDRPPAETPLTRVIQLSHSTPLISDLEHPGGEVETIGS